MDRTRITAGLPSLTPELRSAITKLRQEREKTAGLLRDEIFREASTTLPDGEADTTSSLQQLGRPMTAAEIQRRLLLCNHNLHFEIANNDRTKTGIYIIENRDGLTEKRFICGMESGVSPEFSLRHFTEKKIPDPTVVGHWTTVKTFKSETRGWRTVLAMLLRSKLITSPQIDFHFNPAGGRSSAHWQIQTTK